MRKVTANTTAHLLAAMDNQRAVTIRYVKSSGEVSRRAIEILEIKVTSKGDLVVVAMDRRSGERRTFRLDRITHYTLHRAGKTGDYRFQVIAEPVVLLDDEDAEVIGFRAWSEKFVLAA